MLLAESGSEHSSVDATEIKGIDTNSDAGNGFGKSSAESSNPVEWEEVKKARNRINSQRTRERERVQIKSLEAERARLWLSNDAIKFQNRHFRELVAQIQEVRNLKRFRAGGGTAPSSSTLFGAGALGGGMPMAMRQDVMGGMGGGLDGDLFQNSRLSASSKNLSTLSDADLLARRQANAFGMQTMMRHQEAMDRFGAAAGGVGMGGVNMGLNGRMNGGAAGGGSGSSTRGMNMNGMNMNSSYSDMADNIRIRQLMLQHSAASGDFEPRGLLSSMGGGPSADALSNNNGLGGNWGDDSRNGCVNSNGISLGNSVGGIGGLGDLGGISDAEILHMSKRQKFGF